MAVARRDNLHSRLVYWLKILLPLTALVLLSTLFLISRGVGPEDAIPYADVDVEDRLRNPRLTAPDFAGMTQDGAALSLTADEARLDVEGGAAPGEVRGLHGLLATPDGARTELTAALGHMDPQTRRMILDGGVSLTTSTGYQIQTPGLSVALDRTALDSLGQVQAIGPAFSITSGALRLSLSDPSTRTYLLVFNQGVRVIYQPNAQGTPP